MIKNGIDIESVSRFKSLDESFFNAVFTKQEQIYCRKQAFPSQHFCGLYCAKEALSKAVGGIVKNLPYIKIVVRHDKSGQPFFEKIPELANLEIALSISHTADFAVAVVTIKK